MSDRTVPILLVLALVASTVLPSGAAHEPDEDDFETAIAVADPPTADANDDEDEWEDFADDHELTFTSPSDSREKSKLRFLWAPADDVVAFYMELHDDSDDAELDYLDFAWDERHKAPSSGEDDDDDQIIYRFYRDGTWARVSIEDYGYDADNLLTEPSTDEIDGLDYAVDDSDGENWVLEIVLDWSRELAGWAVIQTDNDDDRAKYPSAANLEKPTTWADLKAVRRSVDIDLSADRTSVTLNETVNLTAKIDKSVDLDDLDSRVNFEQSTDGSKWTSLASVKPDSKGKAVSAVKLAAEGSYVFRARTTSAKIYEEGLSDTVTVTVAKKVVKLSGDADAWIRYTTEQNGLRTYTLVANVTGDDAPTWEISPDASNWQRLSTGTAGKSLTSTWAAPDASSWYARVVLYDADGVPDRGDAREIPSHTVAKGTRTVTTLLLTVEPTSEGAFAYRANVTPAAASGTVTFWRAPGKLVGKAALADGVATLEVDAPLPGRHLHVAQYNGSTTHAAATARAEATWWPDDLAPYAPRSEDASGETIALTLGNASAKGENSVAFTARKGEGPGIPGVLRITFEPEAGDSSTVLAAAFPSGRATASVTDPGPGKHVVRAAFFRDGASGVEADVRAADLVAAKREVQVAVDLPAAFFLDSERNFTVTLSEVVDGGHLVLERESNDTWTEVNRTPAVGNEFTIGWTPTAAGNATIRISYTGSETFAAAVSEARLVKVRAPIEDPTFDAPPVEDATPGFAWAAAALALALVAARRRRS